jgi:cytochrome c5
VSQAQSSDTQFINSFSMVLGLLIFFAIVLFVFARSLGEQQKEHLLSEPLAQKSVHHNIEPFTHEAIAGQDNTALAVVAKAATGGTAAAVPASGEAAFQQVCSACHGAGIAGAPKVGDKAAWGPRIAQGKDTLYKDAIEGKGAMPPRGGTTWPDATIRMTVDYMVAQVK